MERRQETKKLIKVKDLRNIRKGDTLLIDGQEEIIEDLDSYKELYRKLAQEGKLVKVSF